MENGFPANEYLSLYAISCIAHAPTVDVLEQIRAEIEQMEINGHIRDVECFRAGINTALNVIDKYREDI